MLTATGLAAGGEGPPDEEVKGPHAALAVKLAQRDPGRKFLLGERLQYVLLAGARLQDEAAEAPLVAAQYGLVPNYELYLRNKLQVCVGWAWGKGSLGLGGVGMSGGEGRERCLLRSAAGAGVAA